MTAENINFDLYSFIAQVPNITANKGFALYQEGAVRDLSFAENRFVANVQGSYLYKVKLIDDDGIEAYCTCPAAENYPICKHAIAVAYAVDNLTTHLTSENFKIEKDLVEKHLMKFEKDQLVEQLVAELIKNDSSWNALVTKLSFKSQNISYQEVQKKIQIAFPEVEHDGYGWGDDDEYFDSASAQLAPLWENLSQFTFDEQWNLLEAIWNRANEVYPCFHYGDQNGEIGEQLRIHMPRIFQALPWSEQEKMDWLMEYAVVSDEDDYYEILNLLIEPFESNPLLVDLCKKQLENLPENFSTWKYSSCASIVEANAKNWREKLTVKIQMANSIQHHLAICDYYLQNDEALDAEHFLAQTRKKFPSKEEQISCNRQEIKIRTHLGEKKEAWRIANKIFEFSPSFNEYKTLLETQLILSIEDNDLLERVENQLRKAADSSKFIANDVFKFYLLNKKFDKAHSWLKGHRVASNLTLSFYQDAVDLYPKDAAIAFLEEAEREIYKTGNSSYQQAITLLLKIQKILQPYPTILPYLHEQIIEISKRHKAKRNFIALFNQNFSNINQ